MTTGTPPPGPPPQQPQPLLVVPGAGWVDVASRAIVQVGFPVVVAGVLLYYILFKFQQNMDTITSRMAANTTVAQALVDADKNLTAELIRQTSELKTQTVTLQAQEKLLGEISGNAAKLVEIRRDELAELQRRKREGQ